ncbi:MAG: flavodoxin domain-containing protein [Patescibacteria group bacterium]|jgi:menaquinone-dependent protoporphyrinogen IX oxidase
MNTLILYKSRWGTTKLYAEWIHEAYPESDIANIDDFDPKNLVNYETIVIGGRTYMGRIQIGRFMVGNWNVLKDKTVYLFSVGMIHPDRKESKQSFEMIPEDVRNALAGYSKLPGMIDPKKLNLLQKSLAKKHNNQPENVNKEAIQPIVDFLVRNAE